MVNSVTPLIPDVGKVSSINGRSGNLVLSAADINNAAAWRVIRKIRAAAAAAEKANPWNQPPLIAPATFASISGTSAPYQGMPVSSGGGLYLCEYAAAYTSNAGATAPSTGGQNPLTVSDGTYGWTYIGGAPSVVATADAPTLSLVTSTTGLTNVVPSLVGGVPNTSFFNLVGGTPLSYGNGLYTLVAQASGFGGNQANTTRVQFTTDASKLLIGVSGSSNGNYSNPYNPLVFRQGSQFINMPGGFTSSAASGNGTYFQLDWTNSGQRKERDISYYFCNHQSRGGYLNQISVDNHSSIWPTQNANRYRIVFEGDSLTAGNDSQNTLNGPLCGSGLLISDVMADIVGCDDFVNASWISSGFVNNNSGSVPTYIQRLPWLAANLSPDVLMICGNFNDNTVNGQGNTVPQATAGVTTYLQVARAALPNAIIILLGPWLSRNTQTPGYVDAEVAAYAGYVNYQAAGSDPLTFFYSLFTDSTIGATSRTQPPAATSWIQGTGYAAAGQQSTGQTSGVNSDYYTSVDNLHPTALGAIYYGTRLANVFKNIINAISLY